MNTRMTLGAALLAAPLLALAAPAATVVNPAPGTEHLAWRQDPPASGPLAVRSGDRVVTGRVATVSGGRMVVESDFGGTETLSLTQTTKVLHGSRPQDLRSGDVVSAAYHGRGSDRTADAIEKQR